MKSQIGTTSRNRGFDSSKDDSPMGGIRSRAYYLDVIFVQILLLLLLYGVAVVTVHTLVWILYSNFEVNLSSLRWNDFSSAEYFHISGVFFIFYSLRSYFFCFYSYFTTSYIWCHGISSMQLQVIRFFLFRNQCMLKINGVNSVNELIKNNNSGFMKDFYINWNCLIY